MIFNINSTRGHTSSLLVFTMEMSHNAMFWVVLMLGAICGYARSMDLLEAMKVYLAEMDWSIFINAKM